MARTAEVPLFESEFTRREFVLDPPKTAGIIYIASQIPDFVPSAGAHEQIANLERKFEPQYIRWILEQDLGPHPNEIDRGIYVFGQIAKADVSSPGGTRKVTIQSLLENEIQEITLPVNPLDNAELKFSPIGDRLAVWTRTGTGISRTERIFIIDLANLQTAPLKIYEGQTRHNAGYLDWSPDGSRLLSFAFTPNDIGFSDSILNTVLHSFEEGRVVSIAWKIGSPNPFTGQRWELDLFSRMHEDGTINQAMVGNWLVRSFWEDYKVRAAAKSIYGQTVVLGEMGVPSPSPFRAWTQGIKSGEVVVTESGKKYLINEGRKYAFGGQGLNVGAQEKLLPQRLVEKFPESLNKLDFTSGDILTGSDGKSWYIQNGGRYQVLENLSDFTQRRHRSMKVYEVPDVIINQIPEKKYPPRFFRDQYGRQIDGASPRLFVLAAGMRTNSQEAQKLFLGVTAFLKAAGYTQEQILFGTYNMETTPRLYTEEQSNQSVDESLIATSYYLDWLGERAPTAQITWFGHSQSGYLGLRAALSHPGMVCQVMSIDGPLKGVDNVVLDVNGLDLDRVGFIFGEAGEYYVRAGENSLFGEENEGLAKKVIDYGIDFFPFSNSQDKIVRPERGILRNATRRINTYDVPLLWDGPEDIGILPGHGWLLDHTPFLEELVRLAT